MSIFIDSLSLHFQNACILFKTMFVVLLSLEFVSNRQKSYHSPKEASMSKFFAIFHLTFVSLQGGAENGELYPQWNDK